MCRQDILAADLFFILCIPFTRQFPQLIVFAVFSERHEHRFKSVIVTWLSNFNGSYLVADRPSGSRVREEHARRVSRIPRQTSKGVQMLHKTIDFLLSRKCISS